MKPSNSQATAEQNLKIFRIGIGIFLLLRSITLYFEVTSQLGPHAWIPVDFFRSSVGLCNFTLYSFCTNNICTYFLVFLMSLSAISLLFEKTAKVGVFFALVMMLSFLKRSNILAAALDRMAVQYLYLFCWSYLLLLLAPALNFKKETALNFIRGIIRFQICFIYLSAAWGKLQSDSWLSGEAFKILVQYTALVPNYILKINGIFQMASPFLSYTGILFLLSFPILVNFSRTRKLALLLGLGFHSLIFLVFGNLKLVSVLLILSYSIFLSSQEIQWLQEIFRKLNSSLRRGKQVTT